MLYFILTSKPAADARLIDGVVVESVSSEDPKGNVMSVNRNDFESFDEAEMIAEQATKVTGVLHIATDYGAGGYPRFDVVEAPKVGDKVSQYFNGDSYPRGEITHISKSLKKVVTSTGHIFWRRGNSGAWLVNGYASMIPGHVSEMNPSF
jgi:hypothetical protein